MQLVDSHAHIYLKQFRDDLDRVVDRAREAGIAAIYMPNIDHTSIEDMLTVADKYPGYCLPMMGLHPCAVGKEFTRDLYEVEDWLGRGGFVAVGEIGTDLYWDKTFWPQQQEALLVQLDLAKKFSLPFVIHCRDSIDETIELVKLLADDALTGVFHCFTGTAEQAAAITGFGYKLGIGGVATFKNGGLEGVLENTAINDILLETDSPYLAPVPFRGQRNEPAYLPNVANKVAAVKDMTPAEVGTITSANALTLFNAPANGQ